MSPVSAIDPMVLSQDVADISPSHDLSTTQIDAGLQFMNAPATDLIVGGKGRDLRGKQTERVSEKMTAANGGTIQAETYLLDETNDYNTHRNAAEESKNRRIDEEMESENENGTEHKSAEKQSTIQRDARSISVAQAAAAAASLDSF